MSAFDFVAEKLQRLSPDRSAVATAGFLTRIPLSNKTESNRVARKLRHNLEGNGGQHVERRGFGVVFLL
jgi:hypothetical protein